MGANVQRAIRSELLARLRTDLIGPSKPDEVLIENRETREGDNPLSKYLAGILFPQDSQLDAEDDDFANEAGETEEDDAPDTAPMLAGTPKPSSIGLSFAVQADTSMLHLVFRYALYVPAELQGGEATGGQEQAGGKTRPKVTRWQRRGIEERLPIHLGSSGKQKLPGGGRAEWVCRDGPSARLISVFLSNANRAEPGPDRPERCLYQPEIVVSGTESSGALILDRASITRTGNYDPELESYRLLYRDKPEFAVGHGCSVEWDSEGCPPHRARTIRTELLPSYEVLPTEAKGGVGLGGLDMDALASAADGQAIARALEPLAAEYAQWQEDRAAQVTGLPEDLRAKGQDHLEDCRDALRRIREGLSLIASDRLVFEAFKFANRVMMLQRQKTVEASNYRRGIGRVYSGNRPAWHPFQIAFILLNLKSVADPLSADRQIVDLLWFPTGGGKTEAYVGLAAVCIGLRRMRHSSHGESEDTGDGGVAVLMRYTLRLLTIQQFQRAATMICACEFLRRRRPKTLGRREISIGLWVGGSATPNYISQKPDPHFAREPGAVQVLQAFDPENEPAETNPVQLRACPWCGEALSHHDYRASAELCHMQIRCPNETCDFHGSASDWFSGIPAYLVDEDIYLRCPTMLIGTVDKFARLPWDERTKALFGCVDRHCERHGFLATGVDYPKCGGRHRATPEFPATASPSRVPRFLPPELIIQDELHLISGPLGSLVGLYEAAVDFLCSRHGGRPKIVASTATIRRFRDQIRGLFDRGAREFPPPGLIASDSFFAAENKEGDGRLYVGLCAPGRSLKTAQVRTVASLMHSISRKRHASAAADLDPYWTVVYYFNSLRELGGALRLIDDDVRQRLSYLANADSSPEPRHVERRRELTSRVPAREISTLLVEMEYDLETGKALDALLSTNMISVGVDIQRFGLMVVTGQPKTSAEYIQATSRVGRQRPGLIITLFNWSRPRDLSHYERFKAFHSMLYRHVEAGSVTPHSARARDKGMHAVFVAVLRLLDPSLAGNSGALVFDPKSPLVQDFRDYFLSRIRRNDPDEADDAGEQLQAFIDGWVLQQARHPQDLKYRRPPAGSLQSDAYLLEAAEEGRMSGFPRATLNSLREVEKMSRLYFKNFFRRRAGRARL